ncbi:TonB-dependent receptor [Geofilum rubicundum]|uniref:TonB-dependent receptor n=1 Tax=Geofilum rubicundum JCM 15548 TaxID=1236989 RepID=A0A0E9LVY5_9BACT|nr:TonB-dependent receptor [Geofilum rubicundum]GAO29296.1 TonB-dependent receptor [Geofilum rubicundum JCM 15548]
MTKLKFFLSVFLLTLALAVQAEPSGVIKGRVLDADNLSLPGAAVFIESINKGAISDNHGYFTITGIPGGAYQLSVTYIGFNPDEKQVSVEDGETAVVDFSLKSGIELSEIVVSGQLQGQSKALNTQMNKGNITNIISSDQVGRFPDANIGDALKRIPGINVQYDQGEARFGNIRGTSPQYNSVMVNGERIPSAEAEDRTVQLDLVPADMIQSIEVNKAVTPDMDADAIGGAVNLVTRSAPYDRRVSLTLGSGYNILVEKPIYNGAFVIGDRFLNNKLGVIASASYHNHQLGSDNFESEWDYMDENDKDGTAFTEEIQIRQYYLQRIRQSYSLSFDYKLNENHTLFANGIYNHRNDWENRYRTVYKDIEFDEDANAWIGMMEKETKGGNPDTKNARLEDQRMMNFTLGGDHQLGPVSADWTASYSKASEERPNERYIVYEVEDLTFATDFTDKGAPKVTGVSPSSSADFSSDYAFAEITEEFQLTEDIDKNFKLNFLIPWLEDDFKNSLKLGVRYKGKEKMRNNRMFEYSPNDEDAFNAATLGNLENLTKDNFLAGDYAAGQQVSKEYLGELDLTNSSLFEEEPIVEEEAGNFNATENIVGGYVMLNQNLGPNLLVIAGVRVENTSQEYQGNQYDADEDVNTLSEKVSDSYVNVLPGLHLKYDFNRTTILRAAWTNTLARPNYFSLVPYREIEREDNEIAIGNPELIPTTSMNFDLMFEKYFQSIGILSGGVFYKDIKDFIVTETRENYLFEGTTWDTYSQPINGGNAEIFGLELAAQRQLDFLPGFWKNFGVYTNYTYTTSSISDFRIEGREDDDISLPGTAKHTFNGSLSYESKRFSFRTSLNYSSDFVDEFGEEAFYDRYYNETVHLDVNANYAITPKFRLYAEANNLLNTPLYYYQGVSSRLMQAEYYNVRFQFGVKFDL